MARPRVHSVDGILDTARELVLESGARAATIQSIARTSGAPSGSIYHRFGSRDEMLAELWVRTVRRFQGTFLAALASREDPIDAAVAGALSSYDFASESTNDARMLLSVRRQELLDLGALSAESRKELESLNNPVEKALAGLARRIFEVRTRAALDLTALAVVDLPYGAIRRALLAGSRPPASHRAPLERAVRAILCVSEGSY